MVCVGKSDLDLVRAGRKTDDDERVTAGVGPMLQRAIDSDMEVPDAGAFRSLVVIDPIPCR